MIQTIKIEHWFVQKVEIYIKDDVQDGRYFKAYFNLKSKS